MAAPIGNEYYRIRSKDGRYKKYTPDTLLKKANEYFTWVLENPFKESKIVNSSWTEDVFSKDDEGNEVITKVNHAYQIAEIPKMRPFTLEGFCNFAGIVVNTFKGYKKLKTSDENTDAENEEIKDFLIVTEQINQMIDNHQFEGAASGFLNANIIATKLGLIKKQELLGNPDKPIVMQKQTIVVKERSLESD